MKNKIAIVTDTNSGITQEEAKELGIYLIAMPFFINKNTYYEGITLSQEEFFKKLEDDENISTSQPSPGTVIELWDNLLKDYDYILHNEKKVIIPLDKFLYFHTYQNFLLYTV